MGLPGKETKKNVLIKFSVDSKETLGVLVLALLLHQQTHALVQLLMFVFYLYNIDQDSRKRRIIL